MNKTIELSTEELRSIVGGKCSAKGLNKAMISGATGGLAAGYLAGNPAVGFVGGGLGSGAGYLATCWW